jgi:hypothetical protein
MTMRSALACLLCTVASMASTAMATATEIVLDDFSARDAWAASATDEVGTGLRWLDAPNGKAMCLAYDFSRASGYASARRALSLKFPADYEFRFALRGSGAANHLQIKFVDASGDNVWWISRPEFTPPADWQPQRFKKRHIDFAWGPATDRLLRESAAIELTVAAGSGGGRGKVCIDRIRFAEREPAAAATAPLLTSDRRYPASTLALAVDDSPQTAWRSRDARAQRLTLDLGALREFGGLVLRWLPGLGARDYRITLSDDGERWRDAAAVVDGDGGIDPIRLPEAEARYVRIELLRAHGKRYALADIDVRDLAFGASANAMLQAFARESPRGEWPRGFGGEQAYWTVLGVDGGASQALISEDGAIEPFRGGFSLEPFVYVDDRRLGWADAEITQSLRDGDLPIAGVHWRLPAALTLDITAFADGGRAAPVLLARYRLHNGGNEPRTLTFALAVRPLQVNPPSQFLNTVGGVSAIGRIALDTQHVTIGDATRVQAMKPADAVLARSFDQGGLPGRVDDVSAKSADAVDPVALATGALLYRVTLEPGETFETGALLPMTGDASVGHRDEALRGSRRSHSRGIATLRGLRAREDAVAALWRERVDRTRIDVAARPELGATLRTALAHILINRDGAAIQPGTRSYARSWIRDGAMTSGALMRVGHADAARAFLDWYLPFQFDSGKVPCCVDRRGADPVPEHDSHGELIHLIHELFRHDGDRDALARRWPAVAGAIAYMDALRAQERTPKNLAPDRRAYYGLLPPSISHEGYSDRPAYSYWDGFWGLVGYKDAVAIAELLGRDDDARRIGAARDQYRGDLYASLSAAMAKHAIDYLPGAADRGDFDATSTTIALAPGGEQAALPAAALAATFDRYWKHFAARRDGDSDSTVYTPYEWRVVGTFVRLGQVDRALAALDYFMNDRRPAAWNQWAEVVGHDARAPRFIGDMPHGWVASDFIRATLDLFAYEREADRSIVIAAGVPAAWRAGDGAQVQRLRTPYGSLSYRLAERDGEIRLAIDAGIEIPPGGLRWPIAADALTTTAGATRERGEWVIRRVPITLRLSAGDRASAAEAGAD